MKTFNKVIIVIASLVLNVGITASANAEGSSHFKYCANEVKKYCHEAASDDAVFECLKAKLDQEIESISKECKQALHHFERA